MTLGRILAKIMATAIRVRAIEPAAAPDSLMNPAIFHITHVDNLPSIVAEGALWCDAKRVELGLPCTNIGHRHIKERRMRRVVPAAARGTLGQYVPFNFCSRSVML